MELSVNDIYIRVIIKKKKVKTLVELDQAFGEYNIVFSIVITFRIIFSR